MRALRFPRRAPYLSAMNDLFPELLPTLPPVRKHVEMPVCSKPPGPQLVQTIFENFMPVSPEKRKRGKRSRKRPAPENLHLGVSRMPDAPSRSRRHHVPLILRREALLLASGVPSLRPLGTLQVSNLLPPRRVIKEAREQVQPVLWIPLLVGVIGIIVVSMAFSYGKATQAPRTKPTLPVDLSSADQRADASLINDYMTLTGADFSETHTIEAVWLQIEEARNKNGGKTLSADGSRRLKEIMTKYRSRRAEGDRSTLSVIHAGGGTYVAAE